MLYLCKKTLTMKELNTYMNHADYSEAISFFLKKGKKQIYSKKEYYVHVVGYSFENEFVCDYSSFIGRTDSLVSIQALTDCIVYSISLDDYLEYTNKIQGGLHFGCRVANGLFEMSYKRLLALYCDTPEMRYINLMKECPKLKDKVSLKEIASFLGVSPETVSHIRKQLLDK